MSDPKVIEKFLPQTLIRDIEVLHNAPGNFSWQFYEKIAIEYGEPVQFKNPKIINPIGLSHVFIDNTQIVSPHWNLIKPILLFLEYHENFEIKSVLRVRSRRTLQNPNIDETYYNPPHVDLPDAVPYKTLIYYVHDCDGDSVFFNERYKPGTGQSTLQDTDVTECFRNTPVRGTGVLFDGHQYHSGNSPRKHLHRTIINFDFVV